MRAWIVVAALLAAACAATAPPPASTPSTASEGAVSDGAYADARSSASDEAVRAARRAYRSACQQSHSGDYCECMTGGMAQALSPAQLSIATAALGGTVQGSAEERTRVETVRAQVDAGCAQYRRP